MHTAYCIRMFGWPNHQFNKQKFQKAKCILWLIVSLYTPNNKDTSVPYTWWVYSKYSWQIDAFYVPEIWNLIPNTFILHTCVHVYYIGQTMNRKIEKFFFLVFVFFCQNNRKRKSSRFDFMGHTKCIMSGILFAVCQFC